MYVFCVWLTALGEGKEVAPRRCLDVLAAIKGKQSPPCGHRVSF